MWGLQGGLVGPGVRGVEYLDFQTGQRRVLLPDDEIRYDECAYDSKRETLYVAYGQWGAADRLAVEAWKSGAVLPELICDLPGEGRLQDVSLEISPGNERLWIEYRRNRKDYACVYEIAQKQIHWPFGKEPLQESRDYGSMLGWVDDQRLVFHYGRKEGERLVLKTFDLRGRTWQLFFETAEPGEYVTLMEGARHVMLKDDSEHYRLIEIESGNVLASGSLASIPGLRWGKCSVNGHVIAKSCDRGALRGLGTWLFDLTDGKRLCVGGFILFDRMKYVPVSMRTWNISKD
jgi:hypothetical protein